MTRARDLANRVNQSSGGADKNLLINGGMNIWQRSTSQNNISTTGYYTADRWETYISSLGIYTQSQSTDVPSGQGFGYSLKMDCTFADASPSSGNYLQFRQKIEGQNLQHLLYGTSSPKSIALSFWVKSNKTGTYIVEILDNASGRHISKSYTVDSASTWEKKTLTFEGNQTGAIVNSNATGIFVNWWLGAGSNFTSGTLQTSWGAYNNANKAVGQVNLSDSTSNEWYITGCQLEVGEAATDFEFEPYEKTFNKCLRYYYEIGTVAKEGPGGLQQDGGWGTLCMRYNLSFPVPMRASPTANHGTFVLKRKNGGGYGSYMSWTTATLTNTKNNIWPFSNTRAYAQWGQYNNRSNGYSMQGSFPDVNMDAEL